MPTPGLRIDPMTTGVTHISSATPSSPAIVGSSVVGSQAKQPDVHVENEQVVGLQSPLQGQPKRIRKAPPCGTGGHKAGHKAGPTYHGHRGAPHQVVSRPDPSPPPHASHAPPAPEFPPPPHASPSPELPPRTAHAIPDLEIPLPTAHASSHPEIPLHTSRTFFDPSHLSFTPPSFDLGYDFSQTPPVMHTQSPSYSIGHIDHVPPYSHSMSFMPTPGLRIDPMTTGVTHISSATPSSPAIVGSSVVGSQAKQPDVHVENEQVVGLQSPPQGQPKRIRKAPPCGTGGHKAGHKAGPTV
nr:leucine-rich repeat extensin-like protein 3 [Quercus suber]